MMQVSIENTGELSRKMDITVPAEKVTEMLETRLGEISKQIAMPGFRKGHVPMKVVKQQHGQQALMEVTEGLISTSLAEAIEKEDVRPASQPTMDAASGMPEEGKDYAYTVTFDVYPTFTPEGYKGLKLTKETAEVSDEMVAELLDRLSSAHQTFAEKDGAAENSDRVVMNAEGFLIGETEGFAGGKLEEFPLVLGSGQLIPGFESGLEGVKAGEKRDVNVTFPADYHSKDLAGKESVFKCEIIRVEAAAKAEINDEFATKFGEETLEALKGKVREQLATDLATATTQRLKRHLFDALAEANQFTLPESMIDQEFKAIWTAQENDLKQRGLDMSSMGKDESELTAEFKDLAARRVRLGLILAEIGQNNDIRVEKEDVASEIDTIASRNPGMEEQVRQHYANPQTQNEIVGPIFERKVTDWILEQCDLTEKSVDSQELMNEVMQ